jgi:Family of unknown function (DUF5317)
VLLLPLVLGVSLLIAFALGGRLRNLAGVGSASYRSGDLWVLTSRQHPVIRFWPVALVALVLQGAPIPAMQGTFGRLIPVTVLLLSYALLITVAAANRRVRGFALILIGLALNFIAIAPNAGMPVSEAALRDTGQITAIRELRGLEGEKHHLATEDDVLRPLGDVVGIGAPFNVVISPGDIVAYFGAAIFLVEAMLGFPASTTRRYSPRHAQKARMLGTPR